MVLAETSIRRAFKGKTVLLTGVTGFLGSGVLEKLLRSVPEVGKVLVVVRGNPKYSGEDRLRRRIMGAAAFKGLRDSMGMELATLAEAKVEVLEGDLMLPDLGFDDRAKKRLGDVDIMLHCAATVVFDAPLRQALDTNLEGPRRLISMMKAAGARPRLVHVSTCYTCGARRGVVPEVLPGMLPEGPQFDWRAEVADLHATCDHVEMTSRQPDRLDAFRRAATNAIGPAGGPEIAAATERRRLDWVKKELVAHGIARSRALGWNDVYNFTKALAERAVLAEAGDLELAIVRPSIIESAWKQPEPGWLDGFKVMEPILLGYGRGEIPDFPGRAEGLVDIIPVDCVINAVLAAAAAPLEGGKRVFQVSTGKRNPLLYGGIFTLVRDYFRAHPLTGADGYPIVVPNWEFKGREKLEAQVRLAGRALRVAKSLSRVVPAALPAGRTLRTRVNQLDKVIEQARYYSDIYGDYVEMETTFDDSNTVALHESLVPAEREEFGFDISGLDWYDYFMDGHFPAVSEMMEQGRQRRLAVARAPVMPEPGDGAGRPAAAFFDVDGTIVRTTVVHYYLWLELRQRSVAEWPALLTRIAPELLTWQRLDKKSRAAFNRQFYRVYKGLDARLVRQLARETLDEVTLPLMYPRAVQAIRAHRRNGTRVVLLTGALDFLVEPLRPLADEVICARLAEDHGEFTGALDETPIAGEARSAHMRLWAAERNIDLADCWAYADSISDLPMLAAVGHPVAVNPDDPLRAESRRRDFAVADWTLPYGAGLKLPVAT
ncbi:MAG: alcohol-forming fatty acyl-CoA reductase [Chloroflexota bacterium]|nr:alcohol-forming fatty acyl-CoA reductase [Chloroflexota bacterium]